MRPTLMLKKTAKGFAPRDRAGNRGADGSAGHLPTAGGNSDDYKAMVDAVAALVAAYLAGSLFAKLAACNVEA